MIFENSLRYSTFGDRSQIENRIESYDTLVVPSNLIVGGRKAVPALIHKLCETGEVEYYIDPAITELHVGDSFIDDGEIKSWHEKLIAELGSPLIDIMEANDNLVYEDLSDADRKRVAESVCNLQEEFVQEAVEKELGKYESVLAEEVQPRAVIPWYTKISDYNSLDDNDEILSWSISYSELDIKPCIHVEKSFLQDIENRKAIASVLSDHDVEESFVWVDDLDKTSTTISEYINVIRLVVEITKEDVRPHFLYGDYFANLLMFFGLRGIGYGTYHSEDKEERYESSGGGDLQRYYFDPVKDFLSIPDAAELAQEHNAKVPNHSGLISWDRLYKLGKDHDFLKNHFIRTKHEHRKEVLENDLDDILDSIGDDWETYADPLERRQTTKNASHLRKWANAIKYYQRDYPDESESAMEVAQEKLDAATPSHTW